MDADREPIPAISGSYFLQEPSRRVENFFPKAKNFSKRFLDGGSAAVRLSEMTKNERSIVVGRQLSHLRRVIEGLIAVVLWRQEGAAGTQLMCGVDTSHVDVNDFVEKPFALPGGLTIGNAIETNESFGLSRTSGHLTFLAIL